MSRVCIEQLDQAWHHLAFEGEDCGGCETHEDPGSDAGQPDLSLPEALLHEGEVGDAADPDDGEAATLDAEDGHAEVGHHARDDSQPGASNELTLNGFKSVKNMKLAKFSYLNKYTYEILVTFSAWIAWLDQITFPALFSNTANRIYTE